MCESEGMGGGGRHPLVLILRLEDCFGAFFETLGKKIGNSTEDGENQIKPLK